MSVKAIIFSDSLGLKVLLLSDTVVDLLPFGRREAVLEEGTREEGTGKRASASALCLHLSADYIF